MFPITDEEKQLLDRLAERLRELRVAKEEQVQFAARMGMAPATYRRLEQGHPGAPIGYWIRAFRLLGRLGDFEALLGQPSLFEALERSRRPPRRRRPRAPRG